MDRKNAILLSVVVLLVIAVGFLYFYFVRKSMPFVTPEPIPNENIVGNVNSGSVPQKTPADNLQEFIASIENLTLVQMSDQLSLLETALPFDYKDQKFTTLDELEKYIGLSIRSRDDYASKEAFKNSFNFLLSNFFSDFLSEQYLDINNYAYYQKLNKSCNQMVAELLNAGDYSRYRDFTSLTTGQSLKLRINEDYYECKATINRQMCNNLTSEKKNVKTDETVPDKQECLENVGSNLIFYYFLLSKVPCQQIDFSKIGQLKLDPTCEKCQQTCQIFRRETTDLKPLGLSAQSQLRLQAFIDRSTKTCDQLSKYIEAGSTAISECQRDVSFWLAIEAKDVKLAEQLDQAEENPGSTVAALSYFIENEAEIGTKLDQQVLTGTYNYQIDSSNFNSNCENYFSSNISQVCPTVIQDLADWFRVILLVRNQ